MTITDHSAFMREWRGLRDEDGEKIVQAEYNLIMSAIDGTWRPRVATGIDPAWLAIARTLMGLQEIRGPKHNRWIVNGWKRLGAGWFTDDETPWCGLFTAHCVDAAGLSYPKMFPRAKAWLDWGVDCEACLGAVAVFGRKGGGHVGFLVGESEDNWYILGGNQRNAVNIMPLAKSRLIGFRWPSGIPHQNTQVPQMAGGIVSRNEA